MFGYAVNESENYMPISLDLSHKILQKLSTFQKRKKEINYLRPDSKSQVTLQYSKNNLPEKILNIVFLLNMMNLMKKIKC